jgi:hypothetical protein
MWAATRQSVSRRPEANSPRPHALAVMEMPPDTA